jgi:23S rRNA (uracil1939-C5)-methyltransferase
VNCTQTEVLYNVAVGLALTPSPSTIIDAYCGTGTIGLVAAKRSNAHVIGVESVERAVRDARENAKHNGIKNTTFVCDDATKLMQELAERAGIKQASVQQASTKQIIAKQANMKQISAQQANTKYTNAEHTGTQQASEEQAGIQSSNTQRAETLNPIRSTSSAPATSLNSLDPTRTTLIMDPPRAGSTPEFLQAACVLSPARIVYISCNPKTQVRDLRHLLTHGYIIEVIQPVDMFPHTKHVETVVSLTKI